MGNRKVNILEPAVIAVARIAFFIESKGMPQTAKKFVKEAFTFFDKLSDDIIEYRICNNKKWRELNYRCSTYKKKYVIAFLSLENEIVICDFISSKLLH